jgi:hypothetical protein
MFFDAGIARLTQFLALSLQLALQHTLTPRTDLDRLMFAKEHIFVAFNRAISFPTY